MSPQFLSEKVFDIQVQKNPWPYWQIDDFLDEKDFTLVQKNLCAIRKGFLKRDDDEADINYMFLPDLNLAKFFLSDDFKGFLQKITGEALRIYEKSLVQLRVMDKESPAFPIHIDSQDEPSLVCLYYISSKWQPGCGGELCLHESEDSQPSQIIEPMANRLVLFFSDATHWHSVNKVNEWVRYSVISEWICQKGEL